VTDSTPWQPPAGSTPPVPPSPYAAPQAPVPPPAPAPQAGWTPPPKPGLIPLRPLTFGTLLGATFQVLRRNPRPTFGFALVVTGIINVATYGIVGLVAFFAFSRVQFATSTDDQDAIAAGAVALVLLSALVPAALAIVGTAIVQGVISLEVARGTLGERLRLPGLWRAAKGRIGALIGWSALISVALLLAIAIIAVAIALIVAFGGVAGIVVGVLLGFLFAAVFIAAAAWLGTKLSLVPSVLMLERLPLRAALARSWSLTTGSFWRVLGTLLLVSVIVNIATSIITTPLQLFASFGATLINPNGDTTGYLVTAGILAVVTVIVSAVFGAIAAVVQGSAPALIYIDIRMRKEGLDLELQRFVEARQAGDTSVADPYLVASGAAPVPTVPGASPWS